MLFVVHAIDKRDILPTRAKFYRAHRIHLDESAKHHVDVVTAGTLVADDGETPCGSIFVIDAAGVVRWSHVSTLGISYQDSDTIADVLRGL